MSGSRGISGRPQAAACRSGGIGGVMVGLQVQEGVGLVKPIKALVRNVSTVERIF